MSTKKHQTQVDDLRTRISALKAERSDLHRQPLGKADIADSIDRYLAAEADRYRQSARIETLAHRGDIRGLGEKNDSFFAFYFADLIRAALVDAATTDDGVDAADRRQRIADIDAELFKVEVAEEKTIVQAESDNTFITRRADADPHAVLHEEK